MALREQRALDNTRLAIDMHEIFERVTARNHKSFLVHGANVDPWLTTGGVLV